MGKRSTFVLALVLIPAGAWADRHKAGLRAAYADAKRSDLRGIQIGGEWELHGDDPCHQCRDCPTCTCTQECTPAPSTHKSKVTYSVVADLTLVNGDHKDEDAQTAFTLSQFTLLVGPRATLGHGVVQPFGQVLVGFGRLNEGEIRTAPALAFGAGLDFPLGSSADGHHPRLAFRAQVDRYYLRAKPTDWYWQWSLGFVVRFNR